ncbi:MAG: DNA mismatch repair protein MutS [Nitrospirota bacterium]|nr:DNA mismatch repair protein MutS [Nitrospirota bacterium]
MADETPLMRQYNEIKARYQDAILFFRMGDFYEMFGDDAVRAAKILEIALTARNKGKGDETPLCGVPYHAADGYLAKLVRQGFKVAICEQVEDPRLAKGIVKREVIRVVTPGTVLSPDLLNANDNNYLVSVSPFQDRIGLAFVDLSTGDIFVSRVSSDPSFSTLRDEIGRFAPTEAILPSRLESSPLAEMLREMIRSVIPVEDRAFDTTRSEKVLTEYYGVASLDGFGCRDINEAVSAAGATVYYLRENQKSAVDNLKELRVVFPEEFMVIDVASQRNLELIRTVEGDRKGSLLHVLDHSITAMGSRLLKDWLLRPLRNVDAVVARQDGVTELREQLQLRHAVRELLEKVYDLERIISRISLGATGPKDMVALRESLRQLPPMGEAISGTTSNILSEVARSWDNAEDIHSLLQEAIEDNPPFSLKDGGVIRRGYHAELDEYRRLSTEGKDIIASIETRERERTGIASLKVRYNKVFGYYIEITKANLASVPDDYIRKQTLVNAERFITPELKEYEEKVLHAHDRMVELESTLFQQVREKVAAETRRIQWIAEKVALLDVLSALAETAHRNNYTRPEVLEGNDITIIEGRHPVVEQLAGGNRFVPNDLMLDDENNRILIITGPNMAGKSTYMRQCALICIMAQMGSFVPAQEAKISLLDRIFTRVGAADFMARGQSTFMVEMSETANILHNATAKSLIILDEVGRGTSTFDGLSIAWAVVEYLHEQKSGARVLFATHYHELTELALTLSGVKNVSVAVKEWNEEIIFLRKIIDGGADRSYGIQVARLAGLPAQVIERSKEILSNLEGKELNEIGEPKIAATSHPAQRHDVPQLDLFTVQPDPVIKELLGVDLLNMTPLQAMNTLFELHKKAQSTRG